MCEISIVIPVYNKKRYIVDSVKSVLSQTFRDFELLLIDDGSTDGSGAICDRLSVLDERVKVYHTENRGVSATRNCGIRKASGKYIGFIDADDTVDCFFLEKLHTSMVEKNASIATCGYYEVRDGKRIIHDYKDYGSGDAVFELLRQDLLCILWNKLFVREKIKHLFDESISTCEDSLFCTQYYCDNHPIIAYVNEVLYGYTVCQSGLTSTVQKRAFRGINKLLVMNRKVSEEISDDKLKLLIVHHLYKVYFYGIYTYIFGNLSKGFMDTQKLAIIDRIIHDRKYQRIIRFIIKYPRRDKRAEHAGIGELPILFFSLLKMKRSVYFYSKVKRWLETIKNH